jgi:hypothetical protein
MPITAHHSLIANVPRQFAWQYYANVDNWARHEGESVEFITLDGPFQTGARGVTKMKGQEPRHWILKEVIPPEKSVTEVGLPDAVMLFTWTFKEKNEEQTIITQEIELKGPGADQYSAMLEIFAANLEEGMSKFVDRLNRIR